MAEAVIGSLVLKIGAALADEGAKSAVSLLLTWISAMKELKKDISEIKAELRGMQSFLQNAERLRKRDKNINTFIEEIRELAFDIEDIIDEFTYKLGEEQRGVLPTAIKRCKNIITWHHLSKRVKDSKTSLHNITARKDRYNIGSNEIKPSPSIAKGGSNSPAEYAHFFKEDDLVGIDENKDLLLRLLKDEEQQNMIISVWGMGGLGKTTLVTHVYNNIKTNFDACAWVPVSQSYSRDILLRMIIKEFFSEDGKRKKIVDNTDNIGDIDNMDFKKLVETICSFLQNKRYIIILDDVWSIKAWFDIKHAFLDGNNNSKIVLTTRIYEVALLAHKHCMLELKPLEADHSLNLFYKNAFWNNTDRICPPQLKHWAEKIVEKCCGLPLAIVSIGGLLSCKEQLDTEWENVYKDLEWHLTGNSTFDDERVKNILELSFEDLPHYLRNCFLYCCIFPEDYRIYWQRLIRLWVAEGFIEERENRTMEEVAEDYLNELVHRCLLQVADRNEFGRVRGCRMHDIVRVLALSKSKEESFYNDYKHLSTSQNCKARRTSVTSGAIEHWKEDKSHLCSLLLFNSSMSCDLLKSVSKSSKFLRVLDLQGSSIKKVPSEIGNLFNLRFLGLRETEIEKLPKSIEKLQNLQTLDAYDTEIKRLPEGVTNLRKLRHLKVAYGGLPTPKGIWHLKDLQTLQYFEANSEMVTKVGVLINLRTFCITKVRTRHFADLCLAITNMNHLVHLDIMAKDEQEILHLGALCLPRSIRKLSLHGQLDKKYSLPKWSMSFRSLTNLTYLGLRWSGLVEDPLPYIQALPRLMALHIWNAYDGIKLCFKTTSFPTLKELTIWDASRLNQIEIEKEALPSIQKLHLYDCPELKVLPQGIEHLNTLKELILELLAEELTARLRGGGEEGGDESREDRMKIRHIPKVIYTFKRDDGKWVHERLQ